MEIRPFLAGMTLVTLVFGSVGNLYGTAKAASAGDPNASKDGEQMNFRRTTPGSKYRFNKRGIERRLELLTPAKSTFDERSRTLRDAQYRRIIEDLENRVFVPKEDHEGLSEQHETTFERYRRRLRDAQKIQQQQRVHSRQFRDLQQQPQLPRKTKSAVERINERRRARGLIIEAETEQIRQQVEEIQCEDYRAGTSRWANCMYHRRVGN